MWRWVTRGGLVLGCLFLLVVPLWAAEFVGFIERPADGQTVYGLVTVEGWALATSDISRVDLYVDDQFQHAADSNLARTDIVLANPAWPNVQGARPGFRTTFTASRFSNGAHTVHFMVTTGDGQVSEVGRRTINIDNSINQPPLGYVEHPLSTPVYDAHGAFTVAGWAADTDGIKRLDVLVDDEVVQAAIYGDLRPDVSNYFPDFPGAMFSGFAANVDTTVFVDGVHTLSVRATDVRGLSRTIGRRTVQVYNTEANLRPFGFIDEPVRDSVLYGTSCGGPITTPIHYTPVRGWALDLGTNADTGSVSYVELMIDGVRWYSTDDCQWSDEFGGYVNCYGFPTPGVARYYSNFPDSPRAGFMFALDVGALLAAGVPPGHHDLKVRVGDREQTFADIPGSAGIPVFFTCADDSLDFASLGFIEYPTAFEFLKGVALFHGWALDENGGVQNVEIWVDGVLAGLAQYGQARPDVQAAYPTISGGIYSGWAFVFDTNQISDGRHRMTVRVLDREGHVSEIGSRDFFVDNPN